MWLNVDVSGDLDLLETLRARLADIGVRAELREHLMSLMVFAAPPGLSLCVFVAAGGRLLTWHDGQEQHPASDLPGAATRLAARANGNSRRATLRPVSQPAQPAACVAGPIHLTNQGEPAMAEQASAPLRVMTSESSWKCSRTYAARPDQVRHARAFLRRILDGCPVTDDVVLLISELCSNAVQHSRSKEPGGTFTVHVEVYEGEHVWAEVRDCGGLWVTTGVRDDGRGHGLNILRELASDWGRDGSPDTGWTMWFRLDWPVA
jgi:anti-sigma regulatory factor (Ser/Thr protein kinase)